MNLINKHIKYCYRITHIRNLTLILQNGIVTRNNHYASEDYIQIGNPEIIDVRNTTTVRIDGYGNMGEYVPFYFTPKSIMLYNIITGYYAPRVPKRKKSEILVVRCLIEDLSKLPLWFFTDGQGNDMTSGHYNDLTDLNKIDWESIQHSKFSKSEEDFDRARRYQAEFLVHDHVPLESIESLNVYNDKAAQYAAKVIKEKNIRFAVNIQPEYFFV